MIRLLVVVIALTGCKRAPPPAQVCTKVWDLELAELGDPATRVNGHGKSRDEWMQMCLRELGLQSTRFPKRYRCMAECTVKANTLAEASCGATCPDRE